MKRIEKQKKLSTAAKTLATQIENGTVKATTSGYPVFNGQVENVVGAMLKRAGVAFSSSETIYENDAAVAKALGTSPDVLPSNVKLALNGLGIYGARKTTIAKNLREFATAIASSKVRKPYTKSGLYTAAAREAGTFGKQAVAA